jgi:hypothetical protein
MSLALDARQRAMLAEMGVRLWQRPAERVAPVTPESGAAAADQARAAAPFDPEPAARAARPPAPGPRPAPVVPAPAPAAPADSPLGPRPEGIERMDWPQLEAAVAACRACGLCAGRTQTVFGVGSRRADWMVVGEAPGEHEDRQGQPFVGQAGKLLDAMLAAIGLSRQAGDAIDSEAAGADQAGAGGQNDS